MRLTLITPPSVEPLALADAKLHARISTTADDSLVTAMITAARMWVEQYTGRALITQTWEMSTDVFPIYSYLTFPFPYFQIQEAAYGQYLNQNWNYFLQNPDIGQFNMPDIKRQLLPNWGLIFLPKPPLQSVVWVKYQADNTGALTAWDTSHYWVSTTNEPGYIKPKDAYPYPYPNTPEAVQIQWTCGYGNASTAVPQPIILAMELLVSTWYAQREVADLRRGTQELEAVYSLLDPYRFYGFN